MAHEIIANGPDLSPAQARASIVGYIYGVLPGLAIPIVFGLTKPFRRTLSKTFALRCWRTKRQRRPKAWCGTDRADLRGQALKPQQNFDSQIEHILESRPTISTQDRMARTNMGTPVHPNDSSSYELDENMSQHQEQGIGSVKRNTTRPRSLDSTTSFDSLIDWRLRE